VSGLVPTTRAISSWSFAATSGVLREQVPRPRRRVRGGLVPREDQRHEVVAHLVLAEAATGRIACEHDARQEVAVILALEPPRLEQAPHHRLDRLDGGDLSPVALGRPPTGHGQGQVDVLDEHLGQVVHRREDHAAVARHVGVEERLADDLERDVVDVLAHVASLTVAVAAKHRVDVRDHQRRVGLDAKAMERGFDQVVKALPRGAFLREHAVRPEEEVPDLLRERGLHEELGASHIDRVHDVRVADEVPIAIDDACSVYLLQIRSKTGQTETKRLRVD
jgi:hypothetical protein